MPKTVMVTLDGNEHTITELRSRENAEWRKKLEVPFGEIVDLLESGPSMELTNVEDLAGVIRSVSGILLTAIDTVKELLGDYAPKLKPALGEAYDSEIIDAFGKVLGLAYPFGSLISQAKELGSQRPATTPSSPDPNGASGTTK